MSSRQSFLCSCWFLLSRFTYFADSVPPRLWRVMSHESKLGSRFLSVGTNPDESWLRSEEFGSSLSSLLCFQKLTFDFVGLGWVFCWPGLSWIFWQTHNSGFTTCSEIRWICLDGFPQVLSFQSTCSSFPPSQVILLCHQVDSYFCLCLNRIFCSQMWCSVRLGSLAVTFYRKILPQGFFFFFAFLALIQIHS